MWEGGDMDAIMGIAVVAIVVIAGIAFLVWDRRSPAAPLRDRDTEGAERLDTTGPDNAGQRQGGHVNPHMPPIRQDGINNPAGF